MNWPEHDEYQAALQHPGICFHDDLLQHGTPQLDAHGLPIILWGNFAGACRFDCGERGIWAVRLFKSDRPRVRQRYSSIAAHLNGSLCSAFVPFVYQNDALAVEGNRYPFLRMSWVQGDGLGIYIDRLVATGDTDSLLALAENWVAMLEALEKEQVAHGDLQHSNVLVDKDRALKLIDYDGMWVPALSGQQSEERGLSAYQHPLRSALDFGPELDHFSGLVVLVALLTLAERPALWPAYHDDENLLFRASDFADPGQSRLFQDLKSMGERVRTGAEMLAEACTHAPMRSPGPSDLRSLLGVGTAVAGSIPIAVYGAGSAPAAVLPFWQQPVQPPPIAHIDLLPASLGIVAGGFFRQVLPGGQSLPATGAITLPIQGEIPTGIQFTVAFGKDGRVEPGSVHRALGQVNLPEVMGPSPTITVEMHADQYGLLSVNVRGDNWSRSRELRFWP